MSSFQNAGSPSTQNGTNSTDTLSSSDGSVNIALMLMANIPPPSLPSTVREQVPAVPDVWQDLDAVLVEAIDAAVEHASTNHNDPHFLRTPTTPRGQIHEAVIQTVAELAPDWRTTRTTRSNIPDLSTDRPINPHLVREPVDTPSDLPSSHGSAPLMTPDGYDYDDYRAEHWEGLDQRPRPTTPTDPREEDRYARALTWTYTGFLPKSEMDNPLELEVTTHICGDVQPYHMLHIRECDEGFFTRLMANSCATYFSDETEPPQDLDYMCILGLHRVFLSNASRSQVYEFRINKVVEPYSWSVSAITMNKRIHATHGNTSTLLDVDRIQVWRSGPDHTPSWFSAYEVDGQRWTSEAHQTKVDAIRAAQRRFQEANVAVPHSTTTASSTSQLDKPHDMPTLTTQYASPGTAIMYKEHNVWKVFFVPLILSQLIAPCVAGELAALATTTVVSAFFSHSWFLWKFGRVVDAAAPLYLNAGVGLIHYPTIGVIHSKQIYDPSLFAGNDDLCEASWSLSMSAGPGPMNMAISENEFVGCVLTYGGDCSDSTGTRTIQQACGVDSPKNRIIGLLGYCNLANTGMCMNNGHGRLLTPCSNFGYGGYGVWVTSAARIGASGWEAHCHANININTYSAISVSNISLEIPQPLQTTIVGSSATVPVSITSQPIAVTGVTTAVVSIANTSLHVTVDNLANPLPVSITGGQAVVLNNVSIASLNISALPLLQTGPVPYSNHLTTGYLWTATQSVGPAEEDWADSRKKRNKLAHMTNGNTTTVAVRTAPTKLAESVSQAVKRWSDVSTLDTYLRTELMKDTQRNRFAVLRLLDDELPYSAPDGLREFIERESRGLEKLGQAAARGAFRSSNTSGTRLDTTRLPERQQAVKAPTDPAQLPAVRQRLREKLRTAGDLMDYAVSSPTCTPAFLEYLWDTATFDKSMTDPACVYITARVRKWNAEREITAMLHAIPYLGEAAQLDPKLMKQWLLQYRLVSDDWVCDLTTQGVEPNPGPYTWTISAKKRNQLAHATNGNTTMADSAQIQEAVAPASLSQGASPSFGNPIASTMAEVLAAPDGFSDMAKAANASDISPVACLANVLGVSNPGGIATSNVIDQDLFHGQYVDTNNAVTGSTTVHPPETYLTVRQQRNGAGAALTTATWGLQWVDIGYTMWESRTSSLTATAEQVINTYDEGKSRRDAVMQNGFRTADYFAYVSLVGKLATINGDCALVPFLKLSLLGQCMGLGQPTNMLPLAGQMEMTDSQTTLAAGATTSLVFNDPGIATNALGEGGGGPTAFFPANLSAPRPINAAGAAYGNAGCGVITFHQDLASVPAAERTNVIVLPPNILGVNDAGAPGANVALAVAMFCPYPFGFYCFRADTYDTAGGHPAAQQAIPNANLVSIPGITTIRFLLPVVDNLIAPVDQASANANLLVAPRVGPAGSTNLAANATLNVSFGTYLVGPGGGSSEYPLAEFLYSWFHAPVFSPFVLNRFSKQIANALGRADDWKAGVQISAVLANRYMPMVAANVGTSGPVPVNTAPSYAQQSFNGLYLAQENGVYPVDFTFSPTFQMPGCSIPWFTSRVMGVTTGEPMGSMSMSTDLELLAAPQIVQYSRYIARVYATTMHYFFAQAQLPTTVWNTLYTNTPLRGIRRAFRNLWINPEIGGNNSRQLVAPWGSGLANIMTNITPWKAQCDSFSNTLFHYFNAPLYGFAGVWYGPTQAMVGTVCPCILSDVWFHLTIRSLSKGLQAFPVILNKAHGIPASDERVLPFNGGTNSIPIKSERGVYSIGTDESFARSATEQFNKRLAWHCTNIGVDLYTTAGVIYPNADRPITGQIVTPQHVSPGAYLPNLVQGRVVNACTTWIPAIDATGVQIICVSPVGTGTANFLTQVMAGVQFATVESWLSREKTSTPSLLVGGAPMNDAFVSGATNAFTADLAERAKSKNYSLPSLSSSPSGTAVGLIIPSTEKGRPGMRVPMEPTA